MNLPNVHRDLAEICLQYIDFEDFYEPIKPALASAKDENGDLFSQRYMLRQRSNQYALYDYVCTYWPTHLRLSKVSEHKRISKLLVWFLLPDKFPGIYKSWQQMYHHDTVYYCPERPPLYYALDFGISFLTRVLLAEQKNINNLFYGMTALHEASRCGDIDTCIKLLDRGANLELKSGKWARNMTALHFASEGGHSHIIKLFLDRGASPHATSRSRSTPFYRAARSGSLNALRLLYLAGSDVDAETWDHWTSLFEAVGRGLVHIAGQLLAWGGDPTIITDTGQSALTIISDTWSINRLTNQDPQSTIPSQESQPHLHPDVEEDRKIVKAAVLKEIIRLQAQAEASGNMTGDTFFNTLQHLKPGYLRLDRIEKDMRSGIERDSSRVRLIDGFTIFDPEGPFILKAELPSDIMSLMHR